MNFFKKLFQPHKTPSQKEFSAHGKTALQLGSNFFEYVDHMIDSRHTAKVLAQEEEEEEDVLKNECPNCHSQLDKIPARKTKCKHCGEFMFVRTLPKNRARVLVTKMQADQIDEEWVSWHSISSPRYDFFEKAEMDEARQYFINVNGKAPIENDIKWQAFKKQILKHAENSDWGMFRNTRFGMAELLRSEMKNEAALITCLEVCYIDLNGPNNMGGERDSEILKQYPAFNQKEFAMLAPGIVEIMIWLAKTLELGLSEIGAIFLQHNEGVQKALNLPLTPEDCWLSLKREIGRKEESD